MSSLHFVLIRDMEEQMREKESEISNMQKRLLESEVYVRNRNIEIHGVIEESEEDVEEMGYFPIN